jgi:hypothetical protein
MRTLALCGASCKRRSFFYCTRAAWKSLQLLPLLMVEGYVGRSWAVWTGALLNFACTGFSDVVALASQLCYLVSKRSGGKRVGKREE